MVSNNSVTPEPANAPSDNALRLARAIGELVLVLRDIGPVAGGRATSASEATAVRDAVRRALRLAVTAARRSALSLVLADGRLHIGSEVLTSDSSRLDAPVRALVEGLASHGSLTLDVRHGAAPAELLSLARLLADIPDQTAERASWRSWSVRITPQSVPMLTGDESLPAAVREAITRLESSRGDAETRVAVEALLAPLTVPAWADTPVVMEAIALALVREARQRGARGGRLALEAGIRELLLPVRVQSLVRHLPASRRRDDVLPVLGRAGDQAVRELVDFLQEAESLNERRAYFDAIVALDAGEDALREALSDPRWYVVRNAAALLAEMDVVEADTHLLPLLSHPDERVRVAGARALTRLATPRALVGLQGGLEDSNAEVRRLAVAAHGARSQGRPSITALLAAIDNETDEDVLLEILTVFGQLASTECVQRLVRIVRDPNAAKWLRDAAYQSLLAARGEMVSKLLNA